MQIKMYEYEVKGDYRGSLIAIENNRDVPFDIKRVFYIYDTKPGVIRGTHAHFMTQQLLVCVNGSCKITLDDGKEKRDYLLDEPNKALLQKPMIWGKMYDFSDDCVLLVLADQLYDEKDYIREYDKFLKHINKDNFA